MLLLVLAFAFLVAVIASCAIILYRRPGEGIGLPIVALLSFGYLYLCQPLYLLWKDALQIYLNNWQIAKAVAIAAVMLAFFVWGWLRGTRHRRVAQAPSVNWNLRRLWNFGFGTAVFGLLLLCVFVQRSGGFVSAFGAVHGGGLDWANNTAYLYMSPFWIIAGLTMMIVGVGRLRGSVWRRNASVAFIVVLYGYAVLLSSRSIMFATTATLLVSYPLSKKIRITVAKTAFLWLSAGVAVLLILGYRNVLHLGETNAQTPDLSAAMTASVDIDPAEASRRTLGTEFIFHAAVLDTVDARQKYHLGIPWLYYYTVHLVPRILWPGKPFGFTGPGITGNDITQTTGLLVAYGAAPGIVADIYKNFGPLSPFFFLMFGWAAGRLYLRAQCPGTPLAICAYVTLCALSLNAFAQGFGSILVSYPYAMAPAFLFHWLSRPVRSLPGLAPSWSSQRRAPVFSPFRAERES